MLTRNDVLHAHGGLPTAAPMQAPCLRRTYQLVALNMLLLFVASWPLDDRARGTLLTESGPVEVGTALGFFVGGLWVLASPHRQRLCHVGVLLLLFAARELDFDKRFTAVGILKSRFLFSPEVTTPQKLAGVVVLLLLAWAVLRTLRLHTRGFLAGLRRRHAASIGALLVLLCLVTAKAIDGLERKLHALGIAVSQQLATHAGALEEILELGASAYILLVLGLQLSAGRRAPSQRA